MLWTFCSAGDPVVIGAGQLLHTWRFYPPSIGVGSGGPRDQFSNRTEKRSLTIVRGSCRNDYRGSPNLKRACTLTRDSQPNPLYKPHPS